MTDEQTEPTESEHDEHDEHTPTPEELLAAMRNLAEQVEHNMGAMYKALVFLATHAGIAAEELHERMSR
jgi:hypothetical protein